MPEYKIEGILKLTSPLHVATPGDRVINVETLEPKYGKSKGKDFVSYTGTTKYPLAFSEEDMQNEEADDPYPARVWHYQGQCCNFAGVV
jgi:hypothetical protein